MDKNHYAFFFLLFIVYISIIGCSRKFALSDGTSITQKEIIAEIQASQLAEKSSTYYRSKKVNIRKSTVEKTDSKIVLFETINNLKIDKLSDPIVTGKRTIFYLKKRDTLKTYYQPDQINIFQSYTTNDDLFNEEVDRIINLLESDSIEMSQIQEHLNKDYDISVQYYKNTSFTEEKVYKPEVIDLLKNKKIKSVYKTEKVQAGKARYLSLIQNLGLKKENPVCNYLLVTLK